MAFDIANRSIKQNDEASPKPTLNKAELLKTLKADLSASETMQKEWLAKRETYRSETAGRPYGNETAGKSAIITKDIKKQLEWQLPSLAEPFLSTTSVITCEPVTFEDTLAARQNELLLNTQFCRKFPRYNFIMKALRILATEGTVIVRTGWDYEGEDIETTIEEVQSVDGEESIVTTTVTVPKTIINQPTATVCRNDDIFVDPTCMDEMSKCQFVVHRQEVDLSTLRADGRYKNLEKISTSSGTRYGDYVPADRTNFTFKDEPRKKLLMYEYWGNYDVNGDGIAEPIVCAWIDDVIVRLQSNPYPDGKPPFIVVPYNAVPFQLFGEALAETIGDNQKVKTAITRGLIDNMAKSNNAQIGMRKGALDTTNRRRFLNGDNFEYNGTPSDFWQGSYNQIPGSVFDMLSLQNNEIESQTGVKSFSNGISGTSLGNTATSARGAMDATATRRLSLVRNIAENLIKPLMRKWMSYNSEFLDEVEVIRVTNEKYVPVRRDDLAGIIDIDVTISTAEDNSARVQELSFLLQTMGPSQPFEINQMLMAKIAKLSRMPELEKQLLEFKPEPDPLQEKLKELEIRKLEASIRLMEAEAIDLQARAGENKIDAQIKLARAKVEEAKAKKISMDTNKAGLEFLMRDEGYDDYVKDTREAAERNHQLELVKIQVENKDNNIGIPRRD